MIALNYRRLGATEQALWLRDRAYPLHFILTAQISGPLPAQALPQALAHLQQRHPLLRVRIAADAKGNPSFIEQSIPLACRVVLRQCDQQWQREVMRELAQPFDAETPAPLMRVVLVQAAEVSELLVVCHHAIADGLSSVNLLQDLLHLLGNPTEPLATRPIPPSLEALLPKHRPAPWGKIWLARGVLGWQQWRQQWQQRPKPILPFVNSLQMAAGDLSPAITTTLLHQCRQQETTVHAALCTAFLFAIALQSPQTLPGQNAPATLKCFYPVNLRPHLPSCSPDDCGVYVAPAQSTHALTATTEFWTLARSLKSALRTQVKAEHLDQVAQRHELLMGAKPSSETVQQIFDQHCAADGMVTNLGRLTLRQRYGELKLEAIYGPVVLSGFAEERVLGVTTLGDRLSYTFIQQKSSAPSSSADEIMDLLGIATTTPNFTLQAARESLRDQAIAA